MKSHKTLNRNSLDKIKKKAMASLAMHWQMILRHTTQSIITHRFKMSSKRNHKKVIKKGCFLGTVCHIAICKQHTIPRSLPVATNHPMELLEKKAHLAFNWMWTMLCVIFRSNHYAFPCYQSWSMFCVISGPSHGHSCSCSFWEEPWEERLIHSHRWT